MWQSTQENMLPWIECLSLSASTKRLDLLAVLLLGESRVGVAGKAVFVLEFVFGPQFGDRGKRREGQRGHENSSG